MSDASLAVKRADPAMLAEVREGLLRPQKEISPKYFYDHRGSVLFEAITRLPEYYLTRTERALLTQVAPALARSLAPASLLELGAGSADKTRIVLDALHASSLVYVPVDVSAAFLDETAERLRAEYPGLRVVPVVADLSDDSLGAASFTPRGVPHPMLIAFLGSTIGNFADDAAVRLLQRVRAGMRADDRLLLGADLVKDVKVIEAAYNDAQGVTAEFNRNMLRVLNHELGATFDPDAFEHWAFYNRSAGRIEMHLVADADQCVGIPGIGTIAIRRGESIRTEISNKYDRARLTRLLGAADLTIAAWESDDAGGYALVVAAPCA
jgi:L-histidine N-alpha-methyltransferase